MKPIAIGTIMVGAVGGAIFGSQINSNTSGNAPKPLTERQSFVHWCTKPTPEIVAWGVSYREKKGLKPEFGVGLAAKLAFWNACRCASNQIPVQVSQREMELAGKLHGLHIKLDFSKYANKQQRQALKEEGQALAVQYKDILEREPQWAKNLTSKFRECRKVF